MGRLVTRKPWESNGGVGKITMTLRRLGSMLPSAALLIIFPAHTHALYEYAISQFTAFYMAASFCVGGVEPDYALQHPPEWLPPPNATYLYVRGMGDPGTEELEGEVANTVTWDASFYTGFRPRGRYWYLSQRGYANVGPPIGTNVFQVQGHDAGFLINTYQFNHTQPTTTPWGAQDGGPHIAYERRFSPAKEIFKDPSSELTLQVYFKLPWLLFGQDSATAQAILFYYLVDTTSGFRFAGVIQFFDTRPWGHFNGREALRADSHDFYVSSPLNSRTSDDKALRYATMSPFSSAIQNGVRWSSDKFFRAHLSRDNLLNIIEDLETRAGATGISKHPEDWSLLRAGVLVEIGFPRGDAMADTNISVGGSLHHFEIYEAHDP